MTTVISKKNDLKKTDKYLIVGVLDNEKEYLLNLSKQYLSEMYCSEEDVTTKISFITTVSEKMLYYHVKMGKVDFVVTDYKMNTTGVEVVEEVKRINPNIPCLIMSQYEEDIKIKECIKKYENVDFLHKQNSFESNVTNIHYHLKQVSDTIDPMLDKISYLSKENLGLKKENKELVEPLLNDLRSITDQNKIVDVYEFGKVTVAELIGHIKKNDEIGKMYKSLWVETQNMYVKIDNQREKTKKNGGIF